LGLVLDLHTTCGLPASFLLLYSQTLNEVLELQKKKVRMRSGSDLRQRGDEEVERREN